MENCCNTVTIQWIPDPEGVGHNLVCVSCGTMWTPVNPLAKYPEVTPFAVTDNFETAVLSGINRIEAAIDGAGNYKAAWLMLTELIPTKATWGRKILATTMEEYLGQDDSSEDDDSE